MLYQRNPIYAIMIIGIGIGLFLFFRFRKNGNNGKKRKDDQNNTLITLLMYRKLLDSLTSKINNKEKNSILKRKEDINELKREILSLLEDD